MSPVPRSTTIPLSLLSAGKATARDDLADGMKDRAAFRGLSQIAL